MGNRSAKFVICLQIGGIVASYGRQTKGFSINCRPYCLVPRDLKTRLKMRSFFYFSISALIFLNQSSLSFSQAPASELKKKAFVAEKYATIDLSGPDQGWYANMVNTKVIHAPGDEDHAAFAEEKRKANEIAETMRQNGYPASGQSMKTTASSPTVGKTFVGNYFDEIPNDNNIAYGSNGKIVSVTNSRMYIYDTGGGQLAIKTFTEFYSGSGLKFDPKIIWDYTWNRFIFVFLNGDASSTSKVVIAFSATDNPNGTWNVYTLTGNPDAAEFGSTWWDFPQIGLNKKEFFVTGNLFSNSDSYVGGYIYQIDKIGGFNGATSLTTAGYGSASSTTETFAIAPATGFYGFTSPHMWMVSTRGNPFGTSKSVWLHRITDSIAGSPVFQTFALNASVGYQVSPDANQNGTAVTLDTRDTRVRGIYYHNNRIYFACNSNVNGKPGLLFGEIEGLSNPIFASANSQLFGSDSLEISYGAPIYGGVTGANGDHSTLLFFNYTSANHFPGNAVVYIDETGSISTPVICKIGQTYVNIAFGGDPQRWGDYSGISPNPLNPGEAWAAGYYGYSLANHRHGTWISQLYAPDAQVISTEPLVDDANVEMTVFPNPATDYLNISFGVPANSFYSVKVTDMQGLLIKELLYDRLKPGEALATFDLRPLAAGEYIVSVFGDAGVVHSEKFLVAK